MENSRPVSAVPLVSVILLSYNQEDSVGAAIESVLAQDCPFTFELIIGDDASADSTRAVCERYAAARPDVVRLMPAAPNKGVVRNYFDCFSHCRGRYVTDCAGDDRWTDPSKLRAMAALLEADPSVNVVFSDWEILDESTGRRSRRSDSPDFPPVDGPCDCAPSGPPSSGSSSSAAPLRVSGRRLLRMILDHTADLPYNLSASLFRREVVQKVLDEAPLMVCNPDFGCEDLPVMAALAAAGDACYYPRPTLCYRIVPDSLTHTADLTKLLRFHSKSLHAAAALTEFYGLPQSDVSRMFRRKAAFLVALAFDSLDPENVRLVRSALAEWTLPLPTALRLRLSITRSRFLWRIALGVKKMLRQMLKNIK